MAPTPVTVGLFLMGLVLVTVLGVWLMLRADDSSADRQVARGGGRADGFRSEVRAQAPDRGWRVEDPAGRTFPAGAVPRRATPVAAELVVTGDRPRPFRAETWSMEHRNAGAVVGGGTILQHRLTLPLDLPAGASLPGFAVTGDGNWRTMLATVPEALVEDGRTVDGLTVYGGAEGVAERLLPLGPELRAEELWVIVGGREVTLVREGELDVAGLQRRLDLGARVAAALSAP
jgi:hypothetical protein